FSIERGHTAYTSNPGIMELRQEICNYVRQDYQVEYDPAQECIVCVGVSEALDIAIRAITNPGDEILYTEPCFVSYPAEIIMAHGVPVPIETHEADGFALNPDILRSKITPKSKALLINFPCNPTGATMTYQELEEIAQIAVEHDLLILTDEIYSELSYDGKHVSIASLPGMRERTIFLHGFSKAFAMTGWRIGYVCAPHELIEPMLKIHQYMIMCAPANAQAAALEALKRGRPQMEMMRDTYRERRDMLVRGFNEIGLKCHLPHGAFYTFPNITSTGLSSREFASRLLQEHKVAVVPGSAFGECGEGYVRACYATSTEDLIRALERVGDFVRSLKK
ncbi:MAG: aminotransferase class I/II-fold pyridoxal phosphate-dependent enzyme, partial [Victivallaceae bacterium]